MSRAAELRTWRRANPEKLRYHARVRIPRREFLSRWKLAAGCFDCGYAENAVALDFDHVIGEKSFGVGTSTSRSLRRLIAEAEKCVVRCANCHRIATHNRKTA